MTEVLFILTTIFVAYVVYVVVNEPKNTAEAEKPQNAAATPPVQAAPQAAVAKVAAPAANTAPVNNSAPVKMATAAATPAKAAAPAAAVKSAAPAPAATKTAAPVTPAPAKPAAKPAAVAKAKPVEPVVAEPAPEAASAKNGLKNPASGEIATAYSNYRFTKRWIKEALVTEGLLPKVYKNNELTASIEAEIKQAIAKLEAMEKYKA